MSNTVTSINASPVNRLLRGSFSEGQESLLDRIVAQLTRISKAFVFRNEAMKQHKSFIDANLLDSNMGPEINRCLR